MNHLNRTEIPAEMNQIENHAPHLPNERTMTQCTKTIYSFRTVEAQSTDVVGEINTPLYEENI